MLFKNEPSSRLLQVFVMRFFLDGVAGIKFLLEFLDTDFGDGGFIHGG